jgi:hypothetical protein
MKRALLTLSIIIVVVSNGFAASTRRITEITIEENSSWQGFLYKYVLRSDGSATLYSPDWKAAEIRRVAFTGRFLDFDRLAESIERQGFFRLNHKYVSRVFDEDTVVVTAVRDGRRYEVLNYGDTGPVKLWAIENLIRGAAKEVKWDKTTITPSSTSRPTNRWTRAAGACFAS